MPNLPDRTERENELAAALAALLISFRADVERGLADWAAFAAGVYAVVRDSVGATYRAASAALGGKHGGAYSIDAGDQAAGYAIMVGSHIATDIVNRTRAALQSAVDNGGDIDPIFSKRRAEAIAATETTRAISEGESFAAAVIASVTRTMAVWCWRTQEDDRVCPICGPLHGRKNPDIQPPAHPNCRCDREWEFSPIGAPLSPAGMGI